MFITLDCFVSQQKLIANLVKIQKDGTVEVDVERSASVASELLELQSFEESTVSGSFVISESKKSVPRLQIVILVVGTRGDVQPFVAIAKRLQACLIISFQFMLIHRKIAS
jgi:sterol 3beta-glucosyltransferase